MAKDFFRSLIETEKEWLQIEMMLVHRSKQNSLLIFQFSRIMGFIVCGYKGMCDIILREINRKSKKLCDAYDSQLLLNFSKAFGRSKEKLCHLMNLCLMRLLAY